MAALGAPFQAVQVRGTGRGSSEQIDLEPAGLGVACLDLEKATTKWVGGSVGGLLVPKARSEDLFSF